MYETCTHKGAVEDFKSPGIWRAFGYAPDVPKDRSNQSKKFAETFGV
jgi:hypothetical protein